LQAHQGTGHGLFNSLLADLMQDDSKPSTFSGVEMKSLVLIVLATCIVFDLFVVWMLWD
jgi:hypothetical protein